MAARPCGNARAVYSTRALQFGQRQGHRAFQGGGGRQPGPVGQARVDGEADAPDRIPGRQQRPGDPGRVSRPARDTAGPGPAGAGPQPFQRDLDAGGRVPPGAQRENVVLALGRGGRDTLAEREGQHEPLVVVGVLADQVDPAGGEPHTLRLAPVALAEPSRGPVRERAPACRDAGGRARRHRAPASSRPAWANVQASATIVRRSRAACQPRRALMRSDEATSTAGSPSRRGSTSAGMS